MYGTTFKKRPIFQSKSASPHSDDASNERGSLSSKRSAASSMKSAHKSAGGSEFGEGVHADSKWMKVREYLLILIEACLSLSAYAIRERHLSFDENQRLWISYHQAEIMMYYVQGHSAWVSMIIGWLADSYFRYYTMALYSVILHFAAACIVFMDDTIKGNQSESPYAAPVRTICYVSLVLIKSTDFTRLVYGLQGMTNRRSSTICIFIFLQFCVSSYAQYGGVILNVFGPLISYFNARPIFLGFFASGVSLFLFVYLLYPETQWKDQKGLGSRVFGCLLLATLYKILRIRKRGKRGYFENTEGTFTRTTVTRTKEILVFYSLLLPTFGIGMTIMMKESLFYETILKSIKTDKFLQKFRLLHLSRTILVISMCLSYFVIWPLMTLIGFKNKNTMKFLLGHCIACAAWFYAAILAKRVETVQYPVLSTGYVRVFNAREDPVGFYPEDTEFARRSFQVEPGQAVLIAYSCSGTTLFAMRIRSNVTNETFAVFMSVSPWETTGYIVVDPLEVIRIRGPFIPLREGPPGTNSIEAARLYIYNVAKSLDDRIIYIKRHRDERVDREVKLNKGIMTTIALKPDEYDFFIFTARIKKTLNVEQGALYGLLIYSSTSSREMAIDTFHGPSSQPPWTFMMMYFVKGLSFGLCYPALRAIVYATAPHGLMALSFAFLALMEGLASWIIYVNFLTWHYFVSGNVLFTYSALISMLCFLCAFCMVKYKYI